MTFNLCPIFRPAKERLRRYFRLSSRQSDSDNKLTTMENSVTQENTTETTDEPKHPRSATIESEKIVLNHKSTKTNVISSIADVTKQPLARTKSKHSYKHKNSLKESIASDGLKDKTNSLDEVNNSCSNLTSSTYCNTGGPGEYDTGKIYYDKKPLNDRDGVYRGIESGISVERRYQHKSRDLLSDCDSLSIRRESSSTYERDMEIIDLLERERSMDIQEMMERERRAEVERRAEQERNSKEIVGRKNSSFERHRKLPDITKITTPHSPKRIVETTNFPNLVFTHQQSEFVDPRINRNRAAGSRVLNSHGSFKKRNSGPIGLEDQIVPPMICNARAATVNSPSYDGRVVRTRSSGSNRSSTKSIREQRIVSGEYRDKGYSNNL